MAHPLTTPIDFTAGPRVLFGTDQMEAMIGYLSKMVGAAGKVLLVSDPGVHGAGLTKQIMGPLTQAGFTVSLFTDVRSDPTAASVDAIVARAKSEAAEVIIGLGGGSALDAAKLAAAIALTEDSSEAYALCAKPLPSARLPMVMIPTTSGTGSEVTKTVVYSLGDGRKVWAWGTELLPDLAVLDPSLTVGLPPHLTAATGVDAMVHAIEAVTAKTPNAFGETFGLQAIKMASRSLIKAVQQPDDLDARGELQLASMLAGKAIAECGTGVAHAVGHALGADAHVHHGRAVGLVLRAAFVWNSSERPERFDGVATALGVAVSLTDAGLGAKDTDRITKMTLDPENLPMCENNVRALEPSDVRTLVNEVLTAA